MILFVITSSILRGCFGVYSTEDKAYDAIKATYGKDVLKIDRANRLVKLADDEILFLQARRLDG